MTVVYILVGILIFGFLIFIHEFGHFITAKLCGVRVNEFSVNMGPKLFGWKKGETQYSFRLIPIGGYCAMEGEDGDSEDPRSFTSAKWWKRLIILCAGAFMNLVAGFLIVVLLFAFAYELPATGKITGFMEGNVVQAQGLQEGDVLYAINGRRIYMKTDFDMLETRLRGNTCDLTVLRDGKKLVLSDFDLTRTEISDAQGNKGMYLGMYFGETEPRNFLTVNKYAAAECVDFIRMTWYGLQDLFTGRAGLKDMSGPVGIVDAMATVGNSAEQETHRVLDGILNVIYIGAIIAVNLAVMNMLPIPALDGGRVFFLLIGTIFTAITGKKINPKYEGWINGVALVLLLGLIAVIMFKDIFTIIRR